MTAAGWRLLDHGALPAALNMAIDEAVLAACGQGHAPPTLRFYGWDPPAVTLGYFQQPREALDPGACRARGIDWVRRITGGRAVLHDGEVTYSLVAGEGWLPGTVEAAHRRIAHALAAGLSELGLEVELAAYAAHQERAAAGGSAACFDAPARTELTVGGRKLVGSAQVRRWGAVLQHGSIPVRLHARRLAAVVGVAPEDRPAFARLLRARATALAELLPEAPRVEEVRAALAAGFSEAFGVRLRRGQLLPEERRAAARLTARYRKEPRGPTRRAR